MNSTTRTFLVIGLSLIALSQLLRLFVYSTQTTTNNQFKENNKSFVIDSVQYHPAGKDNNLQVNPYWMCHLKGTNEWLHVTENKEVGDTIHMIIKY